MWRTLAPAFLLFTLEKFSIIRQSLAYVGTESIQVLRYYSSGISSFYLCMALPLAVSLLIDWKIIYRMFFRFQKEESFGLLVLLNWISATLFQLSLTHLLTSYRIHDIRNQSSFENRLALVLAVFSWTYLVGFFCVSLVVNDLGKQQKRISPHLSLVSSYVPPVFYLSIVIIAWQADSSLVYRSLVCVACTLFFFTLTISYQVKNNGALHSPSQSVKTCQLESPKSNLNLESLHDQCYSITSNYSETYKIYQLGDMRAKWWIELANDFLISIIPIALFGYVIPAMSPAIYTFSITLYLFFKLFDIITSRLFLSSSKNENNLSVSSRILSYPYQGKCYMNGWYQVLDSAKLLPGQVVHSQFNGNDYAVFRGQDLRVRCVDAHCIHLGANLAVGGKVVNNCLECPFHEWRFDGEGKCTYIPNQPTIPLSAHTKSFHVCEYYGMILVWYHGRDEKPSYYPPSIPKLDNNKMIFRGRKSCTINMHLNEFAENTTDFLHFSTLHRHMVIPYTNITLPCVQINHRPVWKEGTNDDDKHTAFFTDEADLSFCGLTIPYTMACATINIVGPCSLVMFTFDTPIGSVIVFQTHTPVEPLRMNCQFT